MRIVRDSHGFLWFCTLRGLARFDGYSFKSYGVEQGLPGIVTDVLETRAGEYWVATLSGLYRFHPSPHGRNQNEPTTPSHGSTVQPMFELYSVNDDRNVQSVNTLHEDRRGTIWAGTNGGLYRLQPGKSGWTAHLVDLAVAGKTANTVRVLELYEDREGALWISLPQAGVRQLGSDGKINSFTTLGLPLASATAGSVEGTVRSMIEDHDRRMWLGSTLGLSLLVRRPGSAQLDWVRTYTAKDGLRDGYVQALLESSDGDVWAGTPSGLSRFCGASGCGGKSFRSYVTASLGRFGAWTLVNDRDGNVWMGNETGALRLARDGFTTYDEADGLGSSRVYSISESLDGTLYAVTPGPHGGEVNGFDGNHFRRVSPRPQRSTIDPAAPLRDSALQDHAGDWWVTTNQGLYQYSGASRLEDLAWMKPSAAHTSRNGLPPAGIISLYGDSRGDLWVGSNLVSAAAGALSRWQRATRTFHVYGVPEGLSASMPALAFCEDRSGNLWVGFRGDSVGRLARYREGRFTMFTNVDGLPAGSIWSLYLDHAGRLWVATTEGGVARLDQPEAEHPQFSPYTTAEGLASDQIQAITEDQWGRIYLLSDRGVDRLDPNTGWVKHYTSADGLVSSSHWGVAFRDRQGALWFGTLEGLSRLTPMPDEPASPPPIRINAIRVRGDSYGVSELGQTTVDPLLLGTSLNQVQIDFGGFNFGVGDALRYQYKLEGADQDWNKITEQRTVNYATLSPGKYRFLVRAINWQGMASPEPAVVELRILSPIWQRWWFMTLFALAAAGVIYALHRTRVARLVELERIRHRIATDLHDDIGASLSHIAVLSEVVTSEVARQGLAPEGQRLYEPLARIGSVSRELIDSMSDIVWAISPRKDRLRNLTQRMREFAGEILGPRGIEFQLQAASIDQDMTVGPEVRRQVFLIFKEGVNNIVRHSASTRVVCDFHLEGGQLVLRLSDNGRGFCPTAASVPEREGHGLQSMRRRAAGLRARLDVATGPNQGVTVVLRVPLRRHAASPFRIT
jgi:signal transduction histidine kinase/streptogramin lyase